MKYAMTKQQRKKINARIEKITDLTIAGKVCFELDQYQVEEYFSPEVQEAGIKEFKIMRTPGRGHGNSLLCCCYFRDDIFSTTRKQFRTIYPEDIIIRASRLSEHIYCMINIVKQAVGIKLDLENFDMEAL